MVSTGGATDGTRAPTTVIGASVAAVLLSGCEGSCCAAATTGHASHRPTNAAHPILTICWMLQARPPPRLAAEPVTLRVRLLVANEPDQARSVGGPIGNGRTWRSATS